MMSFAPKRRMGWLPDYPDFRDYTFSPAPSTPASASSNITSARPSAATPTPRASFSTRSPATTPIPPRRRRTKAGIPSKKHNKAQTTGALLIRNSWGAGWGEDGCGWLPYDYVLKGLAEDFWTILKKEWIDTGSFAE